MKMFVLGVIVGLALVDIGKGIAQYLDPIDGNLLMEVPGGLLNPNDGSIMPHVPPTPGNLRLVPAVPCD